MKVRIFKPHTHAGVRHVPGPEGLVIELPREAAEYAIAQGAQPATPATRIEPPLAAADPDA
jgi:hypothetical protein